MSNFVWANELLVIYELDAKLYVSWWVEAPLWHKSQKDDETPDAWLWHDHQIVCMCDMTKHVWLWWWYLLHDLFDHEMACVAMLLVTWSVWSWDSLCGYGDATCRLVCKTMWVLPMPCEMDGCVWDHYMKNILVNTSLAKRECWCFGSCGRY